MRFENKKYFSFSMMILLSLMMIFQSQLYFPKIFLLGSALVFMPKNISISRDCLMLIVAYVLFGLWGILIGTIRFTDDPFQYVTTTIIYPILFLPIISQVALQKDQSYNVILRVMFYAHTAIVIYDLCYAFSIILGFAFPNIYSRTVEIGFSYYGEYGSRMNFINLNTLTYTTPIFIMLLLSKYRFGINRFIQCTIIILTIFLLVISGRRSVMLELLILPFLAIIICPFAPPQYALNIRKNVKVFTFVLIFLFVSLYILIPETVNSYFNIFIDAFNSDKEPIKFAQSKMLISKFLDSPFIGQGAGYSFYEPLPGRGIYSTEFELQYHLKLAQTGIIGFGLLMFAYLGILFLALYLSMKKQDIICFSILSGYMFMLLADATNPVMCSFDLMPPFFLCLSRINALQCRKSQFSIKDISQN